jgi:hypothetical protein
MLVEDFIFPYPPTETANAVPTTVSEKPPNVTPPKNSSHPASRGPPSQPPPKAPDSSIPPLPSKGLFFIYTFLVASNIIYSQQFPHDA